MDTGGKAVIMHELGITGEIVRIAVEAAEAVGASHVTAIYLAVGDLASVVDDSIRFCFTILSENTLASGAELVISRVPAELACCHCGHRFRLGGRNWLCPRCGGPSVLIERASQFSVESVEVE